MPRTNNFRESIIDAKELKELMVENARDILSEKFSPQIENMISQTIAEGDDDDDDEFDFEDLKDEEDEVELDLDDEEEHEDEEDDEEVDLDEFMNFLEAVSDDERHSDHGQNWSHAQQNPHMYGDDMLGSGGHEDGGEIEIDDAVLEDMDVSSIMHQLTQEADVDMDAALEKYMRGEGRGHYREKMHDKYDEDYHEDDDYDYHHDEMLDIDLNEFGATSMGKPSESDTVSLSDPYLDVLDDMMDGEGLDVSGEPYNPHANTGGMGAGQNRQADLHNPLEETYSLAELLGENEDYHDDDEEELEELARRNHRLKREVRKLRSEVSEYREALGLLRGTVNEMKLMNSKLLYTNRLMKRFNLSEDQKLNIIEAFDMASDTREAKLVYATLNESYTSAGVGRKKKPGANQKRSRSQMTESLSSFLSNRTGGSTKPSRNKQRQILSEDSVSGFSPERFQKLADISKKKKRK